MLSIINVVIWTIVGVLAFTMDKIPKSIYGITWSCLMLELILKCV
jgi:hypothetical protein